MNFCIIMGKIIEDIKFNFLYNDKRISISNTIIKLDNDSKVKINGYGEIADKMYQRMQEGDIVLIKGKLNTKMEIEVKLIKKLGNNKCYLKITN